MVKIAHGLDQKRLEKQLKEIDKIRKKYKDFKILSGAEVDINKDGSLDLPDDILKQLDVVVASIHFHFRLPQEEQTERVLRALNNSNVNILGHPTGRMINEREPMDLDLEKIMKAAKKNNVALEINSNPLRLDLKGVHAAWAKDMGCLLAISSDAHKLQHFDFIKYGVYTARRGWVEKKDVINTWSYSKLTKWLQK